MPIVILNVGDQLELKTFCTQQDQQAINVYHCVLQAKLAGGCTLQALSDELVNTLGSLYPPCLSTAAAFQGITMRRLAPGTPSVTIVSSDHAVGTGGIGELPSQVSSLLSFQTNFSGRAHRGRVYIPFPGSADVNTDDTLKAGLITAINAIGTLVETDQDVKPDGTNGWTVRFGVYHRASKTQDTITGHKTRSYVATQRRRSRISGGDAFFF